MAEIQGLSNLLSVSRHSERLAEPVRLSVPNAVPYTNIATENPSLADILQNHIYIERTGAIDEISLVALPSGAKVLGGGEYALEVERQLVSEQYPVGRPRTSDEIAALLDNGLPTQHVYREALLVARYGIMTWGHWLGELLPKIVLAEARFPARFAFVLPADVVVDEEPPWSSIRQSLEAYGIGQDRIVQMQWGANYRFARLFAITPVWSDDLIHPEVTRLMRTTLKVSPPPGKARSIAIRRTPGYGRTLDNKVEIEAVLKAQGFEWAETGTMNFIEQVTSFNHADMVFSVLGSDLTNLIYAPEGVRVITAAPPNFGDRFFYGLILDRNGQQIDLRGPVTIRNEQYEISSTFYLSPTEVEKAIEMFKRP